MSMEVTAWNAMYNAMHAQEDRDRSPARRCGGSPTFAAAAPTQPRLVPAAQRRDGGAGRGDAGAGRPRGQRDRRGRRGVRRRGRLAALIAVIAVLEAALGLLTRWLSASIGEDLILRPADRRVRPRAADADRLLHPHPHRRAGQPPQQRRDRRAARLQRHPVRGGAQPGHAGDHADRDDRDLLADHRCCALLLLPIFVLPARRMGARLAQLNREAANHNSVMSTQMTERFSAPGATLVKLFGRPAEESAEFAVRARRVREHRRPHGDAAVGLRHRAHARLGARAGARLRPGRVLRAARTARRGRRRRAGAAADPAVLAR